MTDPVAARGRKIARRLEKEYGPAETALDHHDAFQLLVATILSAQCTDERVNMVTPTLFARYPDAEALAEAEGGELEEIIRSTGFFRSKARSLRGLGKALMERHGGEVPKQMEELVKLPGVGRKTANVILGNVFGVPSITVDTHVKRLAGRLGLTRSEDPERIEQDLWVAFPRKKWTLASQALILHGRRVCGARRPRCRECLLVDLCPSAAGFLADAPARPSRKK